MLERQTQMHTYPKNSNSDKTHFIEFINCYILSVKSPQTLEDTNQAISPSH